MRFKLYALTLSLGLAVGCATVRTNPTGDETQQVRALAIRIADATTAGLTIANEAGAFISQLPVSTAIKNDYDCAVVKVTGTTVARPKVAEVCGAGTPQGPGPLHTALAKLKTITTNPNLKVTAGEIVAAVNPLIAKLETSDQPALKALGLSLRATFAIVLSIIAGGGL